MSKENLNQFNILEFYKKHSPKDFNSHTAHKQ